MSRVVNMPLPAPRTLLSVLATAHLVALASACSLDETVNPLSGAGGASTTTTTTESTTSAGGTGGTGGTGGVPVAPIRTVEQRNPFGDVAATDNLLWDGDFEWSSPFSDQYGWLSGPPYSYDFADAVIGAACRSGVKCAKIAKNKSLLGIGVSSRTQGLSVSVVAKPSMGGCDGVAVLLLNLDSSLSDVDIPAVSPDPDAAGWCQYQGQAPSFETKVYLLIDNNTGAELLADDAVVRPMPKGAAPPPPPMAPLTAERFERREQARAAILAHRRPVIPPKSPARRAFEEHLAR